MHVAKLRERGDGKTPLFDSCWRPDWPASMLRPGRIRKQASDRLRGAGFVEVAFVGTDAECDEIERGGGSFIYRATESEVARAVEMDRALKAGDEKAPAPGQKFQLLDDFRATWKSVLAETEPQRDGAAEARDIAAKVVALMLLGAPVSALMHLFAGRPGIFALTTLHADDPTGVASDSDIAGRTMTDTLGAWAAAGFAGSGIGIDGADHFIQPASINLYYDSVMSPTGVCRAGVVTTASGSNAIAGAVCIQASGGTDYNCYLNRIAGTDSMLYKYNGGYTLLDGPDTFTRTHVMEIDSDGAGGQSVLDNGSVLQTAGDGTWATGYAGLYADDFSAANAKCGAWTVKTAGAPPATDRAVTRSRPIFEPSRLANAWRN